MKTTAKPDSRVIISNDLFITDDEWKAFEQAVTRGSPPWRITHRREVKTEKGKFHSIQLDIFDTEE